MARAEVPWAPSKARTSTVDEECRRRGVVTAAMNFIDGAVLSRTHRALQTPSQRTAPLPPVNTSTQYSHSWATQLLLVR